MAHCIRVFILTMLTLVPATFAIAAAHPPYPVTLTETVREVRFAQASADPYRWMENLDDPRLYPWIGAQNDFTTKQLAGSNFEAIQAELLAIYANKNLGEDVPLDEFLRDRSQGTRRHYPARFRSIRNPLGGLGETELTSPTGKYSVSYQSAVSGDLKIMTIVDTQTRGRLAEALLVKFTTVLWDADESGFIYAIDRDGRTQNSYPVIKRHKIGTAQAYDVVLHQAKEPGNWVGISRLAAGVLVTETSLTETSWGWLNETDGGVTWKGTLPVDAAPFDFLDGKLLFITFQGSTPLGSVQSLDVATAAIAMVYQSPDFALEEALVQQSTLVISSVDQAASRLFTVDLTSGERREIPLPGIGAVTLSADGDQMYASYVSYTTPSASYKIDLPTRTLIPDSAATAPLMELETTRITYTSTLGIEAPIWLIYKKGLVLNADTPTYLYGYGGFNVNLMPRYIMSATPWFKRGGVFAIATLPGGKEMGENWHEGGRLFQKQNVFTSFGAAAQKLIDLKLTRKEKLAIGGGSNGGVLVGATMNLYPDLFQAAVPEVGVMDMTRYQLFTGGKWWVDEYGTRDEYRSYLNLLQVSPYHNIKRRTYPNTLVITGDGDDRVVPSHSYKYAARLQQAQAQNRAAYLYVRRGGSHGATGTIGENVRGLALKWTFLTQELGM